MKDRGLHETEISVRKVMPEESTIDLDLHARAIAVVAFGARRRAWGRRVSRHVELARDLLEQARSRL